MKGEASKSFEAVYKKPDWVTWDDKTYTGDAYEAYSYGAMAVELEIDKATFETKVRGLWIAADIGTVIHPLFAEGQVIAERGEEFLRIMLAERDRVFATMPSRPAALPAVTANDAAGAGTDAPGDRTGGLRIAL